MRRSLRTCVVSTHAPVDAARRTLPPWRSLRGVRGAPGVARTFLNVLKLRPFRLLLPALLHLPPLLPLLLPFLGVRRRRPTKAENPAVTKAFLHYPGFHPSVLEPVAFLCFYKEPRCPEAWINPWENTKDQRSRSARLATASCTPLPFRSPLSFVRLPLSFVPLSLPLPWRPACGHPRAPADPPETIRNLSTTVSYLSVVTEGHDATEEFLLPSN